MEDRSLESGWCVIDEIRSAKQQSGFACQKSPVWKMTCWCCLGVILPIMCVFVPVYARHVLYVDSVISLTASDMRLVDGHVSTTWCQAQNVRMNESFDAYLMERQPSVALRTNQLSMVRHFQLDDDWKEYWGFYLLKGSQVSVTSCARYLGANVMLIKGNSALKFCAYVGQQSDEEESREMAHLQGRRMSERYETAPAPPLFNQPNKSDKQRILDLLRLRNEKRKLVQLLEEEHINSDDAHVPISDGVVSRVQTALQQILDREIHDLYRQVKRIIRWNDTVTQPPSSNSQNPQRNGSDSLQKGGIDKAIKSDIAEMSAKEKPKKFEMSAFVDDQATSSEDGAFEMDDRLTSDGIADDRGKIDHLKPDQGSSSSIAESSFSSSEEMMLQCRGVLLSQPLIPDNQCSDSSDPKQNMIKYTADEDAYYYFIFSSTNEKVRNKLTAKFDLQKNVFNVTDAVEICHNSTSCRFPFMFASSQQVVVAMPTPGSRFSNLWDRTFVVQSHCEPRKCVYILFVLIAPLAILLFR